jgi:DNA mismatch endonuclease (patch repair protein)
MAERWRTPFASNDAVRRKMSTLARRDTEPELALRRQLHRLGLRYYVHRRPLPDLRREADIVFPTAKVAVFVDGCFWHGCPDHGRRQHRTNGWYWPEKIERNVARDRDTDRQLVAAGWSPLRVWEHAEVDQAAGRIREAVQRSSRKDAMANGKLPLGLQ